MPPSRTTAAHPAGRAWYAMRIIRSHTRTSPLIQTRRRQRRLLRQVVCLSMTEHGPCVGRAWPLCGPSAAAWAPQERNMQLIAEMIEVVQRTLDQGSHEASQATPPHGAPCYFTWRHMAPHAPSHGPSRGITWRPMLHHMAPSWMFLHAMEMCTLPNTLALNGVYFYVLTYSIYPTHLTYPTDYKS